MNRLAISILFSMPDIWERLAADRRKVLEVDLAWIVVLVALAYFVGLYRLFH